MARAQVWDVLINSGDTVSGRLMTEAQARKVVDQMHRDATEYFPLTLVHYRSERDQTVVESETFAIEAPEAPEPEAVGELLQGEPDLGDAELQDVCAYLQCGAPAEYVGFGPAPVRCGRHAIFGMATLSRRPR